MSTRTHRKLITILLLAGVFVATVFNSSRSFAQSSSAANDDGRFHDDLLDHLAGKWVAAGIVHGNAAKLFIDGD